MKKHLAILFLAAGMLLGGAQQGQAVDFKAKGVWINMLEYGGGGNFVKNDRNGHNVTGWGRWGEDEFEAKTRVRLQLEAIASESLSGTVYFEIGAATWGSASKGGSRKEGDQTAQKKRRQQHHGRSTDGRCIIYDIGNGTTGTPDRCEHTDQ